MSTTISFEKLVYDWATSRVSGNTLRYLSERRWRRLDVRGDTLNSYGSHFPVIQLIRKRSGKPSHWLLNGDTWSGGWSLTSDHQSAALHYAKNSDLPYVIVPQSVLDAAGIDTSTVQIVDVTTDTYETIVEDFDHIPEGSRWVYEDTILPGTDGWMNQVTGEWVRRGWPVGEDGPGRHDYSRYVNEAPGKPHWKSGVDYAEYERAVETHARLWKWYPGIAKNTGRKRLMVSGSGRHSYQQYDIYADEHGATRYRFSWQRHWLGESLIRAAVPYGAVVKCPVCQGTGTIAPYAVTVGMAEGPMTQIQHERDRRWGGEGYDRTVPGSRMTDECTRCERRSGRITVTKRRWAYYLSGFDHLEVNRSYFFTELPPRARPTTVAEAYESLKPATVRLAEEMGRTVLRQGDQFFIEMPGLTLRELKRDGGVHHKRGGPGRERQQWQPENAQHWQIPRFQRYINEDCWLNGTTHEATEVVRVGRATYARGIVRHVPDRRTPDHAPLKLGDRKTWFLNVPNLTPVGR